MKIVISEKELADLAEQAMKDKSFKVKPGTAYIKVNRDGRGEIASVTAEVEVDDLLK